MAVTRNPPTAMPIMAPRLSLTVEATVSTTFDDESVLEEDVLPCVFVAPVFFVVVTIVPEDFVGLAGEAVPPAAPVARLPKGGTAVPPI